MRKRGAVLAGVVLFAALTSGCDSDDAPPRTEPATGTSTTTRRLSSVELLATVPMKEPDSSTNYERTEFGPAWADVNRNGCDTRNDILNRDLANKEWRARTHACVVILGDLHDPYTGVPVHFEKQRADRVQIDHVVALADAWRTGAAGWTDDRRLQFANDPLELLAVDGRVNQAKGDSNASEWLPPAGAARCAFAGRQVAIKAKWGLWMTPAEHRAVGTVLATCAHAST